MILDAFELVCFVADSHDLVLVCPSNDFEVVRKAAGLDHEAMVSRGFEGVGDSLVNSLSVVVDHRCLAVHDSVGPNNLCSQGVADALVSQADTQEGNSGRSA